MSVDDASTTFQRLVNVSPGRFWRRFLALLNNQRQPCTFLSDLIGLARFSVRTSGNITQRVHERGRSNNFVECHVVVVVVVAIRGQQFVRWFLSPSHQHIPLFELTDDLYVSLSSRWLGELSCSMIAFIR